jgi:citrate synthase
MTTTHYLTAKEAAHELGVSLPTLYAYVSRGLIRSERVGSSRRARRYRREDIEKLKLRKEARRHPERMAESALHLGTPVLESAITLIADGKLYYRGHDALDLAAHDPVEAVAALIWTGVLDADTSMLFDAAPRERSPQFQAVYKAAAGLTPFEQFQVLLPLAATEDVAAYDLRPASVVQTGARILRLMVALAAGCEPGSGGIAAALQQGWSPRDSRAADLINAALILCADHELNVSSFTARCVASANATPYAVVSAGLAALQGAKHGGHTERVEAFFKEAGSPEGIYPAMAARLKHGESIPGFGHPLYPDGDPRGRMLLDLVAETYPASPAAALAQAAVEAAAHLIGQHPTIDLGLVILARASKLPPGSALALFALGRTIGWVGHALEQYHLNRMIRPRARYTGVLPCG